MHRASEWNTGDFGFDDYMVSTPCYDTLNSLITTKLSTGPEMFALPFQIFRCFDLHLRSVAQVLMMIVPNKIIAKER